MIVTLTVSEYGRAIFTGYERWSESVRSSRGDLIRDRGWVVGLHAHVNGAVGELAVAKLLGIYPVLSVCQFSGMAADLGKNIEVRHRTKREYELMVRDKDPGDRKYVLTRGEPPEIDVVGWMWGDDAKQDKYRANHGGFGEAYFVCDEDLYPVETIV